MPSRGRKRSGKPVASPPLDDPRFKVFDFSVENEDATVDLRTTDNTVQVSSRRTNRPSSEKSEDVSGEVQNMMKKIGADISKALVAKTERMEAYYEASFKASDKEIKQVCQKEEEQMQKLHSEYAQKFRTLFQQWDLEMQKFKEKQENLANSYQKQYNDYKQSKLIQMQRGRTIAKAHEEFLKNLADLEKNTDKLLTDTQKSIKKNMTTLQKQVMAETQEQDMANIRKLIQSTIK